MKVVAIEPVTDTTFVGCPVDRYAEHGIYAAVRVHVQLAVGVVKIPLCTVCWHELMEAETGDAITWLDTEAETTKPDQEVRVWCEECDDYVDEDTPPHTD